MPATRAPKKHYPHQRNYRFWGSSAWENRIWPGLWVLAYGIVLVAMPWQFAIFTNGLLSLVAAGELADLLHGHLSASKAHLRRLSHDLIDLACVVGMAIPMLVLPYIGHRYGRATMAFLIALAFVSDTVAYYGGKALGQHKLAPRISPGKTIEGAAFGLLAGFAIGMVFWAPRWLSANGAVIAVTSVALATVGICGDLSESWLKRRQDVKDSGRLLRGHGGILDRIDALTPIILSGWLLAALHVLH